MSRWDLTLDITPHPPFTTIVIPPFTTIDIFSFPTIHDNCHLLEESARADGNCPEWWGEGYRQCYCFHVPVYELQLWWPSCMVSAPQLRTLVSTYSSYVLKIPFINLIVASFLWDIGKQCKTRPDAAECCRRRKMLLLFTFCTVCL